MDTSFMEAQGYSVVDNIVYQDNQSAILQEGNGRASSGRRTRHIDIRYFFASDRIAQGELRVEYCPTTDMIADFFTKPLQGSLFKKFRALILNMPEEQHGLEASDHRSVLEHVPRTSDRRNDPTPLVREVGITSVVD